VTPGPGASCGVPTVPADAPGGIGAHIRLVRQPAVREPLHGGLAALRSFDEPGHRRQLGVGADPGRLHDETATGIDGGAHDTVTGLDVDGRGLTGEERDVYRRASFDDDPVGSDLLARSYDEALARAQLGDRHSRLHRAGGGVAQHRRVLGSHGQQRPKGRAGARLGPGLEVAACQHQGRNTGGNLEVQRAGPLRVAQ